MNDREKLAVGALVALLLFLAPGYLLHVSPRFAGSLAGGMLGVAGATLLVLLLVYPLVKHVTWLNTRVTRRLPLRSLLTFHVYAGVAGPVLGVLHSGHDYQSPLGIALVVVMLVVVLSGFVGYYYLAYLSAGLRQQEGTLATLRDAYNRMAGALAAREAIPAGIAGKATGPRADVPILPLVDTIAELEYAIGAREKVKRILGRWMVAHVSVSIVMYFLLALHVWSGLYYGLRWLP
ncbi:MAG: iron reductase [Reyranella sp.]|nr:iron reductase [Reyranella sp.]